MRRLLILIAVIVVVVGTGIAYVSSSQEKATARIPVTAVGGPVCPGPFAGQHRVASTYPCMCPQSCKQCCSESVYVATGSTESTADSKPAPPLVQTPTLDVLAHKAAREAYRYRFGHMAPGCVTTRYLLTKIYDGQ